MIESISSTQRSSTVGQYPAAMRDAPPPSKAVRPAEDSVALSAGAQQSLSSAKAAATMPPPSFDQVIRDAAGGDIRALARLVMLG
jgi:hypothetical protein